MVISGSRRKNMRHILRQLRGFTLVEVLIAVVVIAILAGLVYGGLAFSRRDSRNTAMIVAAAAYKNAYKNYRIINNKYPDLSPGNETTCLGQGYDDINNDGVGDCFYYAAPTSEDPQVTNELDKYFSDKNPPKGGTTKVNSSKKGTITAGQFSASDDGALIVDGKPRKYYISYVLEGYNRDCKLADSVRIDGWPDATGWPYGTVNNARNAETWTENGGGTICITLLPG